jgi:hypothetical protein
VVVQIEHSNHLYHGSFHWKQRSHQCFALNGISDSTKAKWAAGFPQDIVARLPPVLNLTMESITENGMQINSIYDTPRLRYLITKLGRARMTMSGK